MTHHNSFAHTVKSVVLVTCVLGFLVMLTGVTLLLGLPYALTIGGAILMVVGSLTLWGML